MIRGEEHRLKSGASPLLYGSVLFTAAPEIFLRRNDQ